MYWFENPTILRQFPVSLRCYAAYCRSMWQPATKTVRGGSFVLGAMRKLRQAFKGPAEAMIRVDGLTVFIDPYADRLFFAFEELLKGGDEGKIMRSFVEQGDTFLDVGANHGTYSLLAARLVGARGAVLSFEPQPHLAGLLRKSFTANHLVNCSVHEVALSDREGETSFFIPRHSGLAGIHKEFSASGSFQEIKVKLSRFDNAVAWRELPGNVFVKLDVEGSELPFLLGAEQMIRARKPAILMEINPQSAKAAGYSVEDLINVLRGFGYTKFAEMDTYPATLSLTEMTGDRMDRFQDILLLS